MKEQYREQIKSIVSMPVWEHIEAYFIDEILEGKKPINFKTEGKTADIIAIEVIAREKSAKIVMSALNKLRRIKNEKEFEKQTYK